MPIEFEFEGKRYSVELPAGARYHNIVLPDGRMLAFHAYIKDCTTPHFVGLRLLGFTLDEAKEVVRGIYYMDLAKHVANTPVAVAITKEG